MSDYLNNNFVIEPNIKETTNNFQNYKKLIEDRYSEFHDGVQKFYNLMAAPLPLYH